MFDIIQVELFGESSVSDRKLVCAVGSRNGIEDTKLLVLDFDVY